MVGIELEIRAIRGGDTGRRTAGCLPRKQDRDEFHRKFITRQKSLGCLARSELTFKIAILVNVNHTKELFYAKNVQFKAVSSCSWAHAIEPGVEPADSGGYQCSRSGGFEDSNAAGDSPSWTETSTNFGTPICSIANCGNRAGTALPRSGIYWAWFGGVGADETGTLSQTVIMPSGSAFLQFYLWVGDDTAATADLAVSIDGTTVFAVAKPFTGYTAGYTLVTVNVSNFADGSAHNLRLVGNTAGGNTNISVDDISIVAEALGQPNFNDGRLNNYDPGAPVAIYGVDFGNGIGLHIYRNSNEDNQVIGRLGLIVTPEDIASVPEKPEQNTVIKRSKDGSIALYRLTTGEFQINVGPDFEGKIYVFIFTQLAVNTGYTSFDLNPAGGGGRQ